MPPSSVRVALAALVTAALASGGAAAIERKPGIVAGDDRVITADPRFRPVGRLNKSGTGFCTATLIAPDLILTAAHCLFYGKTGRPIPPDRLHFVAGWRKGEYLAHRRGRRTATHPDYDHAAPSSARRMAVDIALVWLDRPISGEVIRPMPIDKRSGSVRLSVPLTHVSYAEDRAHLPSVEHGCIVRDQLGPLLLTDCDANYGGSGAPVLAESAGGLAVLGVMSGALRVKGLTRTGAVRATTAKAAFTGE